jgi:signal transduction histidine kinase
VTDFFRRAHEEAVSRRPLNSAPRQPILKHMKVNEMSARDSTAAQRPPVPARLSMERKLPLLIGALLVAVIAALSIAAYVEVRSTSQQLAAERLQSVTNQFRDLFTQSGVQLRTQAIATANKPAVMEFARTRAPRLRDKAREELVYGGANRDQVIASELRDSTEAVILTTASASNGLDSLWSKSILRDVPADSAAIGRYRLLRDTLVYAVAAPVRGAPSVTAIHWRRVAGSRRAREQMTQLIGSDASLFVGNADGSLWTDLERPVAAPPLQVLTPPRVHSYARGPKRERYLASAASIRGTPWVVAVDFPYKRVFAPGDMFVPRIGLIALAALALGLFGAWLLSRSITGPLAQLTDAADSIAGGDYSQHPDIRRSDELGRLGYAFGTMATELQQARGNLEQKVEQRTRDLNETLHQLKETQEALVRREKLAMLGQLASGVGHELRNPLGVMTNAVYYLKMVLQESPQTVKEYLDILQQQITLSEKIVGDLLDFARLKPPQRKAASIGEVTQAQLSRLGPTNGTKIETELPESLPKVLVDQVQIGQIVLNLLTNAMQALEPNGGGEGETNGGHDSGREGGRDGGARITIRARAEGGKLHYEVADNGPGIPRENLEKIFEPLFTTKARGIGLGLAVSRTLARANEGDLTVRSTIGKGAIFRLSLPIAEKTGA